jgi:hypothetical protein
VTLKALKAQVEVMVKGTAEPKKSDAVKDSPIPSSAASGKKAEEAVADPTESSGVRKRK